MPQKQKKTAETGCLLIGMRILVECCYFLTHCLDLFLDRDVIHGHALVERLPNTPRIGVGHLTRDGIAVAVENHILTPRATVLIGQGTVRDDLAVFHGACAGERPAFARTGGIIPSDVACAVPVSDVFVNRQCFAVLAGVNRVDRSAAVIVLGEIPINGCGLSLGSGNGTVLTERPVVILFHCAAPCRGLVGRCLKRSGI